MLFRSSATVSVLRERERARWVGREARRASYEREMRRARASERKDDDGKRKRLPRAVGAGAPLFWTLGAGLSGSAGPCTDSTE